MPDRDLGPVDPALRGGESVHAGAAPDQTLPNAPPNGPATTPVSFDDRPTSSFTEAEWQILETHMAAYFTGNIDMLAAKAHDLFGGQRFVGLWKFPKAYRDGLDKKFPYTGDQNVRVYMDHFFAELRKSGRQLLWARTILLIVFLAAIFGATYATYPATSKPDGEPTPPAAVDTAAGTPATAPTQLAQNTTFEAADAYPIVLAVLVIFYFLLWFNSVAVAKRRNNDLHNRFQNQYQIGTVTRLLGRYMGTHDLIATTRLRPPHTPTPEAQRLVKQIERFAALMIWTAKRVEYYEKRFEVEQWRLLAHHFRLNLFQYASLVILFGVYVVGILTFTDTDAGFAVDATKWAVLTAAIAAGASIAFLPVLLGLLKPFRVGGVDEFEAGLATDTWIRYATFNLHTQLSKVVGDQVRRIHQEEDRPR